MWVAYGQWAMRQLQAEKARAVLQRALQSLPRSSHVEVIVQFALLEFKMGSVDRARTIFESVLANYPKRIDGACVCWGGGSMYIYICTCVCVCE